jgi:cytochrome c peroxidase
MVIRGRRVAAGALLALAACGGEGTSGAPPPPAGLSLKAQAGKALFFDVTLSASGRQSCGTCHVPERAFTADPATDQGLPVPLGGRNLDLPGFRNAPSLRYAALTPAFFLGEGTPTGGFFRDGRASSLTVQAQQPLVSGFEMANQDAAEVLSRLEASPQSRAAFVADYGEAPLTALPRADGRPDLYQYNDLPVAFDAAVNSGEIPYTPPKFAGGQAPTLEAAEIDDVVAFLCTLTDGFDPNNPAAYEVPAQCLPGAP